MPAGLLGCVLIGLMQGSFQSVQLAVGPCSEFGAGRAVDRSGGGEAGGGPAAVHRFAGHLDSIDLTIIFWWLRLPPTSC